MEIDFPDTFMRFGVAGTILGMAVTSERAGRKRAQHGKMICSRRQSSVIYCVMSIPNKVKLFYSFCCFQAWKKSFFFDLAVGYSAIFVRGGFSWYTFCLDVCSSSFGEFKFIVFLFSRSSPVSLVFPPFPKTIKTVATHTSAVCSRDSLLHYYTHTRMLRRVLPLHPVREISSLRLLYSINRKQRTSINYTQLRITAIAVLSQTVFVLSCLFLSLLFSPCWLIGMQIST